jgi:Golgi apparatus protein 1
MTKTGTSAEWLLVAAAALALAAPVLADDTCDGDIQRFCQNIPAGGGRIYACLQSNLNRLSDSCKATMDEARQAAYDVSLSCEADVFSWCRRTRAGEGRILACLMSQLSDLSSTCQDAIASQQRFQSACGGDLARLCHRVPAGGGRKVVCLLSQKSQLSDGCRAVLEQRR